MPLIRLVNPLFTYTDFHPVTAMNALAGKKDPRLLKASLTICPYDRMHRTQSLPEIQWTPPHSLPNRVSQPFRLLQEELRIMRGGQALQEHLHSRRQPVVNLVPRRPQSITSGRRQCVDLQHSVVGGDGLERDIRVPARGGEAAHIGELVCQASAFLLLFAAYDGDLVAEFGAFFGEGMDVEGGGGGLGEGQWG